MKDYLNAEEKNQFMVLCSVLQIFKGVRNMGIKNPAEIKTMLEDWNSRGNLTKDEHRSLKMAGTYINKFCESVYERLGDKEKFEIERRLGKFDFRLVDDYTLKKVYKQIQTEFEKQEEYRTFAEEIMDIRCKGCTKDYKQCELYKLFDNNFIEESGFDMCNCKYAYKELSDKKKQKIKKKYSKMLKSKKADQLRKKHKGE